VFRAQISAEPADVRIGVFRLTERVSARLPTVKSLQKETTTTRNVMGAQLAFAEADCFVDDVEASPFFQEMADYAVLQKHIVGRESPGGWEGLCAAFGAKTAGAIEWLDARSGEVEVTFRELPIIRLGPSMPCARSSRRLR